MLVVLVVVPSMRYCRVFKTSILDFYSYLHLYFWKYLAYFLNSTSSSSPSSTIKITTVFKTKIALLLPDSLFLFLLFLFLLLDIDIDTFVPTSFEAITAIFC